MVAEAVSLALSLVVSGYLVTSITVLKNTAPGLELRLANVGSPQIAVSIVLFVVVVLILLHTVVRLFTGRATSLGALLISFAMLLTIFVGLAPRAAALSAPLCLALVGLLGIRYLPSIWFFVTLTVTGGGHTYAASVSGDPWALVETGGVVVASGMFKWLVVELVRSWERRERLFTDMKRAALEVSQMNLILLERAEHAELEARDRERTRIARDVHDTVGYTLTNVLVQVSASRELLSVDARRISDRLERLEQMIRDSISQIRNHVRSLREEDLELHWTLRIEALCRSFADATGIRVTRSLPDGLSELDESTGAALFRVIQESLTNAVRHSEADRVDVTFVINPETVLLRISDDGVGARTIHMGNGLKGIHERVRELGGDVRFQSQPGRGFDIGVTVPRAYGGK